MKIHIICVGKVREKFFRDAIDEYTKRLSRFCRMSVTEVSDEPIPDNAAPAEELLVLSKEGDKILRAINPSSYVVALTIDGTPLSSEGLAKKIESIKMCGKSEITFIIGGSLGLCDKVTDRADFKLSFSAMTFPHQLMRVILAEQLFRACKINAGESYHK